MMANPYQQYQESSLETATPGKLLLMLYDGAIRFLIQAEQALEAKKYSEAHNFNLRAQDIITELICCLNMEVGEVSQNLYRLYEYLHWRLVQSNIKREGVGVREVIGHLRELRSAWAEAVKQTAGSGVSLASGAA